MTDDENDNNIKIDVSVQRTNLLLTLQGHVPIVVKSQNHDSQ